MSHILPLQRSIPGAFSDRSLPSRHNVVYAAQAAAPEPGREATMSFGPTSWAEQKAAKLCEPGWLDPHSSSEFDDGFRLVGQRVFVEGYGEGRVRAFSKSMLASPHEIYFEEGGIKEVKLRRKGNSETAWLLGPHIYASMARPWDLDEPEPEPEPTPAPRASAGEQEAFRLEAQQSWGVVSGGGTAAAGAPLEADPDSAWVDGSSLDDTPRHLLTGTTILVELSQSLLSELYSYEGEATDESSPRHSPFAKAMVGAFQKKRIGESVHSIDFTLAGKNKHPLGKRDLHLERAHKEGGIKFKLLKTSWVGLLKDPIAAGDREQRLCVVYENQRSQIRSANRPSLSRDRSVPHPPRLALFL